MTPPERDVPDEPPPFLGSWKRVYTVVLVYFVLLVCAFYAFMRVFS